MAMRIPQTLNSELSWAECCPTLPPSMRSLELDFGTMRRFKYPATRLALLPGLVRAALQGVRVCSVCFRVF